jgi:hypothetical protein
MFSTFIGFFFLNILDLRLFESIDMESIGMERWLYNSVVQILYLDVASNMQL